MAEGISFQAKLNVVSNFCVKKKTSEALGLLQDLRPALKSWFFYFSGIRRLTFLSKCAIIISCLKYELNTKITIIS